MYDGNGKVTDVFDALGKRWVKQYDRLNRVSAEIDPLGNTKRTTFDEAGRVFVTQTPNGFPSTNFYDGRGRLAKWVDAMRSPWLYDYDGVGNITNITDALQGHYVMIYSNRNERIYERNQDNFEWFYNCDKLLRLHSQRDPNKITKRFQYDEGGRLREVAFNTGRVDSMDYDENDNLRIARREMEDPDTFEVLESVKTAITPDRLDRMAEVRDDYQQVVRYDRDALGRIVHLTYPGGKILTNQFDAIGRLTNQIDWLGNQIGYQYDNASRLVRRSYPNGIIQTNTFDDAGRLNLLSHGPTAANAPTNSIQIALNYAYDRNGNKTSSRESGTLSWLPPPASDDQTHFTPSGRLQDRLVTESGAQTAWTYHYDASGNLTNAATASQSYVLAYDEDNRTTSIAWTTNGATTAIANRYDFFGRRIARTLGRDETQFVLDLSGNMERILCDRDAAGHTTAWYIHGPDLVYKLDAQTNLTCYHADALANIIALTGTNGLLLAQYAYDPYGRVLGSTNFQVLASDLQPYLFVGSQGVKQELPGLYFMRARYYLSESGTFLSTDPVKNLSPGGVPLLYFYATGNPFSSSDPSGLFALYIGGNLGASGHNVVGGQVSVSSGVVINFNAALRGDWGHAYGLYETHQAAAGIGLGGGGEVQLEVGFEWGGKEVEDSTETFEYGSAGGTAGFGGDVSIYGQKGKPQGFFLAAGVGPDAHGSIDYGRGQTTTISASTLSGRDTADKKTQSTAGSQSPRTPQTASVQASAGHAGSLNSNQSVKPAVNTGPPNSVLSFGNISLGTTPSQGSGSILANNAMAGTTPTTNTKPGSQKPTPNPIVNFFSGIFHRIFGP